MATAAEKKRAEELYESPRRHELFEEAYGLFPEYNLSGDDTEQACDYIINGLTDGEDLPPGVHQELWESVWAGLT